MRGEDYGVILVAVDGSENSLVAAGVGARLATMLHARLGLVHVLDVPPLNFWVRVEDRMKEDIRAQAEQLLTDVSRRIAGACNLTPSFYIVEGSPDAELCRLGREQSDVLMLIAGRYGMASERRSRLARAHSGGLARKLVRQLPVPSAGSDSGARVCLRHPMGGARGYEAARGAVAPDPRPSGGRGGAEDAVVAAVGPGGRLYHGAGSALRRRTLLAPLVALAAAVAPPAVSVDHLVSHLDVDHVDVSTRFQGQSILLFGAVSRGTDVVIEADDCSIPMWTCPRSRPWVCTGCRSICSAAARWCGGRSRRSWCRRCTCSTGLAMRPAPMVGSSVPSLLWGW
jgi:nucleotide-binding universal stress UspA family protein